MIFGHSIVENAEILADGGNGLDHIEILLFHTPSLHNIPTPEEVQLLREIGERTRITYTVHLPSSLEIASSDKQIRERSIRMINQICRTLRPLMPEYYILHIPVTPPTLVPVPGQYFTSKTSQPWEEWTARAMDSLKKIRSHGAGKNKLLLENINYSPKYLAPMVRAGLGGFCLDIGHLLLGNECVSEILNRYLDRTCELHLHGVKAFDEHLSLDVLPIERVEKWMSCLNRWGYKGIINLEVFSPDDLERSLHMLTGIMAGRCDGD